MNFNTLKIALSAILSYVILTKSNNLSVVLLRWLTFKIELTNKPSIFFIFLAYTVLSTVMAIFFISRIYQNRTISNKIIHFLLVSVLILSGILMGCHYLTTQKFAIVDFDLDTYSFITSCSTALWLLQSLILFLYIYLKIRKLESKARAKQTLEDEIDSLTSESRL